MYYLLIMTSFYLKIDALSKNNTIYTTIEDKSGQTNEVISNSI